VSRNPFQQPPRDSLLPRTSTVERPIGSQSLRLPSGAADPAAALIGKWATAGAYLEIRDDGTFSRVSHSARGTAGGVIGVDDNGKYEVSGDRIIFHGMLRERTCLFSITAQNELMICDVAYRRE
jgi:hypothetical protein